MSLKTTQESIEELKNLMEQLGEAILAQNELFTRLQGSAPSEPTMPEQSLDYDDEEAKELKEDLRFHKRRGRALIITTVAFGVLSLIMYFWMLPLFGISFGFFLSLVITDFVVLFFDPYILPGDSIKRISKNGVGAAIVWLSFAIMLFSGVQVGNSLITNRGTGEELNRAAPASVGIGLPAQQPVQQPAAQPNVTNTTKEN